MVNLITYNIGLHECDIVQTLNENGKWNCFQRRQQLGLLIRFPNEITFSVRSIWFTDENTFTAATAVNSQNDRYIGPTRSVEIKIKQVPKRRCRPTHVGLREREQFSHDRPTSWCVSDEES